MALFIKLRQVSSSGQNFRTSAGRMSALKVTIYCKVVAFARVAPGSSGSPVGECFVPTSVANRWRWISRLASTRARTFSDGSPRRWSDNFSYPTCDTTMWMSMRSRNGPDICFWYFVTVPGVQAHGICSYYLNGRK